MKYLTITTFPNKDWHEYLHITTISQLYKLPEEVPVLLKLFKNDYQEVVAKSLESLIQSTPCKKGRKVHFETGSTQEEIDFFIRHKDFKNEGDYRTEYVAFAHKVFALYQAYLFAKQEGYDYLIWLDADILLTEDITTEDLAEWTQGKDIAYLGRDNWDHSECGFVAYKVETAGRFIERFHEMYVKDEILSLPQYHDSYVFDKLREEFKDLSYHNISEGYDGDPLEVFNNSILGAKMTHYKGAKGKEELMSKVNRAYDKMEPVHLNDIHIKTKNCVDKEKIRQHIQANRKMIRNWFTPCKKTDETIIVCSAGPSLNPLEIREHYKAGKKIVAVKHAVKPLAKAGIIPWAVVLLDPRAHVEGFIDDIHHDTLVFVASMVAPIVTEKLIEKKYNIIGYHVAVGVNETDFLHNGDCIVVGGSATATRGLSLLEGLGFRNIELYGYDCCYHEKPDLKATKEDGTLKYQEITIEADTYAGKVKRTFWTEGQFLAQLQEFRNYYFRRDILKLNMHGDGMIPWAKKHMDMHKLYLDELENEAEEKAINIEDFLSRLYFHDKNKG